MKMTGLVFLVLIGSAAWAAAEAGGCDACGSECASACGTRHFRACCFNYLRRKREPAAPAAGLKVLLAQSKAERRRRPDPLLVDLLEEASRFDHELDIPLERLQLAYYDD